MGSLIWTRTAAGHYSTDPASGPHYTVQRSAGAWEVRSGGADNTSGTWVGNAATMAAGKAAAEALAARYGLARVYIDRMGNRAAADPADFASPHACRGVWHRAGLDGHGRQAFRCDADDARTALAAGLAALADPAAALERLGAVYSPDLDAYASGELDICQVRCALCGLAPCDRDDGTATTRPPGWAGPSSFWAAVRNTADDYRHDLSDGQPCYLEIWVEASGMVPQAARVAHDFGAAVFSAGGFNGLTDKYETAERLASESRPVVILHIGDYDPSGCAIIDALAEDVSAFAEGLGAARPEFRRVAATPEQIARYGLSTAPQKVTDNRGEYMPDTVQAEALPPDVLTAELRAAIEALTDTEALTAARALGDAERAQILGELREFGGAR
jgi:hypothetical protein